MELSDIRVLSSAERQHDKLPRGSKMGKLADLAREIWTYKISLAPILVTYLLFDLPGARGSSSVISSPVCTENFVRLIW
jgi:hypothetical protein